MNTANLVPVCAGPYFKGLQGDGKRQWPKSGNGFPLPAAFLPSRGGYTFPVGGAVYDAALSRSKQDSEYHQHPPIGSLSFGRGLG